MSHHPFFVAVHENATAAEFAVVDGPTRHWFHGHIAPGPEGVWVDYSWADRESVNQRTRPGGDPALAIFEILNQWLNTMTGRNPDHQPPLPVFLSAECEALDYVADAFRRAGLPPRFVRGTANHPPVEPIANPLTYVRNSKNGAA